MQIGVGLLDELHQDFQPLLRSQLAIICRIGPGSFCMTAELGGYTFYSPEFSRRIPG
jgi:hypothetical protein